MNNNIYKYAAIGIISFILGNYTGNSNADRYVEFEIPVDVIKTVAHVEVSNPDLELIFTDSKEDISYYRYIGNRELINKGDTVYLYDGTEYVVTSTSINGFNMKSDTPVIMGMSGMAVLDTNGNQVGYISSLLQTNEVYCIWS